MKMSLSIAVSAATCMAGVANAAVLYSNPWEGTVGAYASQNDTSGFVGNYATCYGFFSTGGAEWSVKDIHFVGEYFYSQAPITGFTVNFYQSVGNAPGNFLGGSHVAAGNFTESYITTFVIDSHTYPVYQYDMNLSPLSVIGDAWVSIVPDLAYPPQWGWCVGLDRTAGHEGWQNWLGTMSQLFRGNSLNLQITGDVVPAPGAFALLGVAALRGRRRQG